MKETTSRSKWIWMLAGGGVVLLLLGAFLLVRQVTSDSTEDLLSNPSPTPAQIRKITTNLLVDSDLNIRSRAGARLSELGERAKPIVQEVANETDDSELRFAVLAVLRSMDSTAAAQVVSNMIQNTDALVRREAVRLAGTIENAQATSVLEKAIEDPDPATRAAAAAALDPRDSNSAATKLRQALNDPEYNVRRHAARQLRLLQSR